MNIQNIIGRNENLFHSDLLDFETVLAETIQENSFLVIGGAGTIGQAVTIEIIKRNPKKLHVIDISENNLVELVRDIRSSIGYIDGDFKTFAIDCGSKEYDFLYESMGPYDFILNLSALKHVRSEKDPYTLMRMVDVNIFNTIKSLHLSYHTGITKYFCVSTDKAANPVNMMGGSKRIMEMFLMRESLNSDISMARFANVAFSDGSLLHGFNQRFAKRQPIAAPNDVKRYFLTGQESGELCLLSCILGENRDIFFPKLNKDLNLITFSEIVKNYLNEFGYEAFECSSEEEARRKCKDLIPQKKWPCFFFKSDTTGEKDFEEFFTDKEKIVMNKFSSIGIIKNESEFNSDKLSYFQSKIKEFKLSKKWNRNDMLELFHEMIPNFGHNETGKFLDERM